MAKHKIDVVMKFTTEGEEKQARANEQQKTSKSRADGTNTSMERLDTSVGDVVGKFKLLGLIGIGTMSALLVNTPRIAAGFEVLKIKVSRLFNELSRPVGAVFKEIGGRVDDLTNTIKNLTPRQREFLDLIVKWGAALSIGAVVIGATSGALMVFNFVMLGIPFKLYRLAVLGVAGAFKVLTTAIAITRASFALLGVSGIIAKLALFAPVLWALAFVLAFVAGAWKKKMEIIEDLRTVLGGFKKIFDAVVGVITGSISPIDALKMAWRGVGDIINGVIRILADVFIGTVQVVGDKLAWLAGKLGFNWLEDFFLGASDAAEDFLNWLRKIDIAGGLFDFIKNPISSTFGAGRRMLGFQDGGVVPNTGLHLLHVGETVIPAGQNAGTNITFTGDMNVRSQNDIDSIVNRIMLEIDRKKRMQVTR